MSTIAHLTLAQYDRMIAAGVFEQRERQRLEFIHGGIRQMNPIGSRHEVIVDRLTEWSFANLPKGKVWVRIQNSIGLPALDSAPEPDLAWVVRRDYSRGRPVAEDVLLVVEVADSSLALDTGEKADLYAAAGIADYWVVDVIGERIEVRRGPLAGHYQSVSSFAGDEELRPLSMPEVSLRPASLWPAPSRNRGARSMSSDELQPKPEAFLDLIRRQQRGRLKIYLGFAAGVGKTYDMLQEGNRLRRQGIDVVIGFVEAHGRAETIAQIGELERVPRRRIEYRGIVLEEMDIDAVLARRPTIALVDELAHTNAPGSRNPKRYQDVEELVRAGISVITTMNIQHVESLHDIVERATGVRVKERIPDYVVTMADQIVNVDLSAEDLRDRLQAGKIYPSDRVATAMDNFFAAEKLTQLRELAMEEIAFHLDQHRREESQRSGATASGSERVMVCLSSRSPHAPALLRKAARIADRLGAPWYAVYVQTPRESVVRIDAATARQIEKSLGLARQLGGTTFQFKGPDLVSAIATFVKEYGITHIVVGRSRWPWYRRWFGPSVLDCLLQRVPGVDVVVVDNSPPAAS